MRGTQYSSGSVLPLTVLSTVDDVVFGEILFTVFLLYLKSDLLFVLAQHILIQHLVAIFCVANLMCSVCQWMIFQIITLCQCMSSMVTVWCC